MMQESPQPRLPTKTNLTLLVTKVSQLLWLGAIALFAYIGEHEKDGGFISEIWEQAKVASPFAAMLALFLLIDERRERREAQQMCHDRTVEFIHSTNMAHTALDKMASAVAKRKGH